MRKRGGGNCEGTGAEVHRGGPKSFIQLRETVGGRRECRIRPFPKRSAGPCARRGPARSNRIPHREHEQILPSAWRGQRTSMTRQTQKKQHTCHACTCVGFSHKDIYAREFLHGSWRGRTKNEIIRDLASWSRRPNLSCTTLCRCILCRTCKLDTLKRHAITAQMMDAGGTCTLCNPTNGRKA